MKIVTKKTYERVIEACNYSCVICGSTNWLALHHIKYRSEAPELINEITNCVMLCNNCHLLVHSNKHKYQPQLQELASRIYKEGK